MMWILYIGLLFLGVAIGFVLGTHIVSRGLQPDLNRRERNMASDRKLILHLIRRDIANVLVRKDPARFFQIYQKAYEAQNAVSDYSEEKRLEMLKKTTDEYPYYSDFDIIGRREYVIDLPQLFGVPNMENLENHFLKLVQFQSLMGSLDPHWFYEPAIRDDDMAYAMEYQREIEDKRR